MDKISRNIIYIIILLVLCFGTCAQNLTVSGISSGGYMAVQLHVSFSSKINGVGVLAGGPYWCAEANIAIATTSCMVAPALISVNTLITATYYAYGVLSIDNPSNINNARVWLYSGRQDSIVVPGVVQKLQTYYQNWISSRNIQTMYSVNSEHAMITNSFGNNCLYLGSPFINNCNFDAAGSILQWIIGSLNSPGVINPDNLVPISQSKYIPGNLPPVSVGLQSMAFAYVPPACQANIGGCDIHVAFHGCHQTLDEINATFVVSAGYNQWAETNKLVIIYPQAAANTLNPEGCWDWWGYTGTAYATKLGVQVATVMNMVNGIKSSSFADLKVAQQSNTFLASLFQK